VVLNGEINQAQLIAFISLLEQVIHIHFEVFGDICDFF
jgi:hypothetical protein